MKYEHPDVPVSVKEIQGYIARHPLDCTKDSREIMADLEKYFGWRIRISCLVLAALWQGYGVIPFDSGNSFRFCKVEK